MTDTLHIGIDDTDSPKGMCTTFLAYKITCMLKKQNVKFLDFPRLIRFNPNVPWKTRGNGAVSLNIKTENPDKVKAQVTDMVKKYSDTKNGANPGLVFADVISDSFAKFSDLALWQLVSREKAKKFAKENTVDFFYQGNGQGLVGAIGAIGYHFDDHTFELLNYRSKTNFGKKRLISSQSVQIMHEKTYPNTFSSFDEKRGRVLITPHGPDPVFCGIRGENTSSLLRATSMLDIYEKLDGYMIFKSNQGTGDHLKYNLSHDDIKPYTSGMITGIVNNKPNITKGGHVFFIISFDNHKFHCAVYRPTGMSSVAQALIPGDKICVGGGIRRASKNFPQVFNVEFIQILHLQNDTILSNPICQDCSKSMKSKGVGQGYQCVRCKKTSYQKQPRVLSRRLKEKRYIPIVSAHRHLTKPIQRKAKNINSEFTESIPWIHQYSGE